MSSADRREAANASPFIAILIAAFALPFGNPAPASGYQFVRGPQFVWPEDERPVRYWISDRSSQSLSLNELISETRAAFDVWEGHPQIGVGFSYQGRTKQLPFHFFDATNTIGFSTLEHLHALGISETTLAITSWLTDADTGGILEADIIVNPLVQWTTTTARLGWDYRSMMVHEGGHFLGLGHSNVGRSQDNELLQGSSVMWPYSFGLGKTIGRTLTDDDIAGASVLYPGIGAARGSISGTIIRASRERVGHAHVIAYEPTLDHLVGAWADANGDYEVGGLLPGRYVLRVNPLPRRHPISTYFFRPQDVDADFKVTVLRRFVVVPENGEAEVNIEVSQ